MEAHQRHQVLRAAQGANLYERRIDDVLQRLGTALTLYISLNSGRLDFTTMADDFALG
jgi:hypothetical protein